MKTKWLILIVLAASIASHFAYFGHPNETVFDEVHFGKFISGYFTHEYFFDIHPPLGKLLISGMGELTGFKPGFSFGQIGDKFPDNKYLWLRLLPTIAGTLLPLVLFLLALELGLSRWASFTLGILTALENSMIAQSRMILLDSFLLLFGFAALYCYFRWRPTAEGGSAGSSSGQRDRSRWYLLATGILAGMAVSIKWTGLSFLAIIGIFELFHLWQDRRGIPRPGGLGHLTRPSSFAARKRLHTIILCLIVVPIVVYTATFVVHLKLLSKSGPGDAFMTPEFRKTLVGSTDSQNTALKPLGMVGKIVELNAEMYRANAGLTAGHPYASKWYTWPFMQRPIYYWYQKTSDMTDSRIYFMGNPLIWWATTLAIIFLILDQIAEFWRKRKIKLLPTLIILGYVINMLPFIGITRAMFLYHYLIGYIFALLALAYLVDQLKNKKRIFIALVALCVAGFLFFAPLTYGLPLSAKAYNLRNWLSSWR